MPKISKSFEENIKTLSDELELAIHWKRPSILLAICKSKPSQIKAENALQRLAQELGQGIKSIPVDEKSPNAAKSILDYGHVDQTIFFVSNLDQGGGEDGKNAYRILNLYRELIVEQEVRCVFWLTLSEASNLPKFAPDFWAFRHRVVEFSSPHAPAKTSLPAGVLIWHNQDSGDSAQGLKDKVRSRQELLGQLPERAESWMARIEILGDLGHLYWMLGENNKAWQSLSSGILLAGTDEMSQIRSWLLNGQAIILYEKKEYREASEIYAKILKRESKDGFLWMNMAVGLHALGKNTEAGVHARKAMRLSPEDARLWNTLGHLTIGMGKPDEAVSCFKKAVELGPKSPVQHMALAVCYSLLGLSDEARQEIDFAHRNPEEQQAQINICQEAILGNLNSAQDLLKSSIAEGRISRINVQRDPIWNEVFGDSFTGALI